MTPGNDWLTSCGLVAPLTTNGVTMRCHHMPQTLGVELGCRSPCWGRSAGKSLAPACPSRPFATIVCRRNRGRKAPA